MKIKLMDNRGYALAYVVVLSMMIFALCTLVTLAAYSNALSSRVNDDFYARRNFEDKIGYCFIMNNGTLPSDDYIEIKDNLFSATYGKDIYTIKLNTLNEKNTLDLYRNSVHVMQVIYDITDKKVLSWIYVHQETTEYKQ